MAYDAARGRVVLFGGGDGVNTIYGDTWEWDGSNWSQPHADVKPPARLNASLTYDAARGRTVLFGGATVQAGVTGWLADTWEWDGATWSQRASATSPSARSSAGMVYDSQRGRVVLFGGIGSGIRQNDTWEWDGTDWTQLAPASSPPARNGAGMAYDSARGRAVLFGGYSSGDLPLGDTWEWDGNDWHQLTPAKSPTARVRPVLAYDSARGRVVLFGGGDGSGTTGPWSDTWEWDGTTWVKPRIDGKPYARGLTAMAFDAARGRTVLFGGCCPVFSDTWEYAGGDTGQRLPAIYLPLAAKSPKQATEPRKWPMVTADPAVWSHYISTNGITEIALDEARNELWAATWGGLLQWDLTTETYTYLFSPGLT